MGEVTVICSENKTIIKICNQCEMREICAEKYYMPFPEKYQTEHDPCNILKIYEKEVYQNRHTSIKMKFELIENIS